MNATDATQFLRTQFPGISQTKFARLLVEACEVDLPNMLPGYSDLSEEDQDTVDAAWRVAAYDGPDAPKFYTVYSRVRRVDKKIASLKAEGAIAA